MDLNAWFEVYLGNRWYTFDARNNMLRMARVLIGGGRDAVDVSIANTFGVAHLARFEVTRWLPLTVCFRSGSSWLGRCIVL